MNPSESNFSNIQETANEKQITPLRSSKVEIFHSLLPDPIYSNDVSSIVWSEASYPETMSSKSKISLEQTPNDVIKSPMNYDQQAKNKRIKIIIIGIITALILVIIAMIVILSVLLKSQNTMDTTQTSITTKNVNSYSSTTAATNTPIIYDIGNGGASGDPPCSSYTVVKDPLRNVNTPGIGGTCDNGPLFNTSIGGRWIRFIGTSGTIISLTSPGINHCGAYIPGWFNGTLPSTTEEVVSAEICFDMPIGPYCNLVLNASVVNCGSFYTYFLPPVPICNGRYCTI